MKDRFDLENEISQTSIFAKHLRDLRHGILESQLTKDETVKAIEGLAVLIEVHERVLFNTFIQTLKLDKYNKDNFSKETGDAS
jgi:hypothetical protein